MNIRNEDSTSGCAASTHVRETIGRSGGPVTFSQLLSKIFAAGTASATAATLCMFALSALAGTVSAQENGLYRIVNGYNGKLL